MEILKFIATNHKDPILGQPNVTDDKDKEIKSIEMLQSNALNCVRGSSARTISHLLYNRKNCLNNSKKQLKSYHKMKIQWLDLQVYIVYILLSILTKNGLHQLFLNYINKMIDF